MKKLLKIIIVIFLLAGLMCGMLINILSIVVTGASEKKNTSFGNGNALTGNAAIIYEFYHEKGVRDIQIAAILGNMYQESHLQSGIIESNGEGVGLCQWSFGRKKQYIAYCESIGAAWDDINAQLEFSWFEFDREACKQSNGLADYQWIYKEYSRETFDAADSVAEATTIYCYGFERCNRAENMSLLQTVRIPKAQMYYDMIRSGGIISTTPAGECASVEVSQRLQWLFPEGTPRSAAEMQKYLVWITVPINTPNGESTMRLCVHKKLANEFIAVFEDLMQVDGFYTNPSCTAGYNWRMAASGTGNISHHSYGCVVDQNWTTNPADYGTLADTVDRSSPYYNNPEVVAIWKAHGFYWGGDWSAYYYDPMHFTYTNH